MSSPNPVHGLPSRDRRQNRLAQGRFLLVLKGKHPVLEKRPVSYFDTAPAHELVTKTILEKGHGRIETRIHTASQIVVRIRAGKSYPGQLHFEHIETLVRVLNRRITPVDTRSTRGFTSLPRRSTSNGTPTACTATGASRECIGCSISSSRASSPAISTNGWKPISHAKSRHAPLRADSLR